MNTSFRLLAYACSLFVIDVQAQTLTLDQVVRRARDRARQEEGLKVAQAIASEQYLEALSKFRVELRPRIGILAFSNPALLATNIGAGMLFSRTPVSKWSIHQARLDRLESEIAALQAIGRAERDAIRVYFQRLAGQRQVKNLMEELEQKRMARDQVRRNTRAGRATSLELASWETRLLALEAQLEQAEHDNASAGLDLRRTIGMEDDGAELQVAELEVSDYTGPVPTTASLQKIAFVQPAGKNSLRSRLEAEKKALVGTKGVSGSAFSINYGNIRDRGGNRAGLGPGGFLLGGNSGSVDLGISFSLRQTGENAAINAAMRARVGTLELRLDHTESEDRWEVESLRLLAISSRKKFELAQRKLRVAEESIRLVTMREKARLATTEMVIAADMELRGARVELERASFEKNSRWLQLLAAARLDATTADSHRQVIALMKEQTEANDAQ
jgi:outer membrane protein TolC